MALKKINYTGSSKVILRLCEMVNQLIDGGGGSGSTVTYTQTLSSGTKTGSISIDGVSTDMYAPTPPVKVSDLTNDSGFITSTVNNLTNYYLKSETYTQAEVDALISAIVTLNILVVQTLPTQDISTTTIYLVPKQTAETQDIYDEYIYVNNAWEHIGTTQIDLSNYYTKAQVDTLLADKVDKVAGKQLSTEDFTSTLKTKLDGIETGAEVNVQSDWNQSDSSADDFIKNKPTIPPAQIQSDWNQTDNTAKDFIKNKPTIPDISNIPISGIGELNVSSSTPYPVITMNSGFNLKEGAYLSVKFNSALTVPYSEPLHTYITVLIDGTTYGMESYIGNVTIDAGKVAIIVYDGSSLEVVAVNNSGGTSYSEGDGIDITNDTISVDTIFTEASTRANIASGDTFATILGKIKKWFTDLPSMFVSKLGDTISGVLEVKPTTTANTLFRVAKVHSSTTNAPSDVVIGNNIPDGTAGASNGRILLYGTDQYYALITASNVSGSSKTFELPNKGGTIALTSDTPTDFVSKTNGGTFEGNVTVDRQDGTTSITGKSTLIVGNNISRGANKNSKGVIRLYARGTKYVDICASDDTAINDNREINLPDKSGTLALISDIKVKSTDNTGVNKTVKITNMLGEQLFYIFSASATTSSPTASLRLVTYQASGGGSIGNATLIGTASACTLSDGAIIIPHKYYEFITVISPYNFTLTVT